MLKKIKHYRTLSGALVVGLAVIVLAACASQPAAQAQQPTAAQAAAATQAPTAAQAAANTSNDQAAATQPANAGTGAAASVSFSKDILPVMQTSCINCHGGEKISKGLDLKTYDSLMAGSQNGAVLVPGDAAQSKLIQSVQSGKMPKRGDKLTAEQIQLLVDWVNAGATNN